VPGQGRSESSTHYARQGEPTHSRNGTDHGGAYSGIPVPPRPQPGVGHGVSVNYPSGSPMARGPRPAQPANVPRARPPSNIPVAQGVLGGSYYQQWYLSLLFLAAVTSN